MAGSAKRSGAPCLPAAPAVGPDCAGLSPEQVGRYRAEGYVLASGLIPESRLAAVEARFLALARGELVPPSRMKLVRDVMVVKGAAQPASPLHAVNKLMNFEQDPVLYGYVREPALVRAVASLIGAPAYSVSTNLFNKPPGVDGRHPLHQDLRYFRLRPADGLIGVWTALGRATRESGCLAVLPGSHLGPLHAHTEPDWFFVNAGFFGIPGLNIEHRRHLSMRRGDTLLFHPLLIHGSGRNRSADCRRAISCHYATAECRSPPPDWRQRAQVQKL